MIDPSICVLLLQPCRSPVTLNSSPLCHTALMGCLALLKVTQLSVVAIMPLPWGLVLGDVGEIIEDQEVEFVELGNGSFEGELAAGNLQSLDEIGGKAKRCRKVALAAAWWSKQR